MKIRIAVIALTIIFLITGGYFWCTSDSETHLEAVTFKQLPGWRQANPQQSLTAFKISCNTLLKQKPDTPAGTPVIPMTIKDWEPACRAAMAINNPSAEEAKAFFERWFKPYRFYNHKPVKGLFTGYYVTRMKGSLTKTEQYPIPIYGTPNNLVSIDLGLFDPALTNRKLAGRIEGNRIVPYYSRKEINQGAISKSAPVIAWVDNPIDRLFLEIQGSGIIDLDNGSHLVAGYAAQNGLPYTAIGRVLIQKGLMDGKQVSMQTIRKYLEEHPDQQNAIINKNKSFVFFARQSSDEITGVQNIALTPGYSMAVDRRWIPIGLPIWVDTTHPEPNTDGQKPFQRLLIAQDTGGAIRGMVRGDIFWGSSEKAAEIAGKMKSPGYYWLLLPKRG